MNSIRPFCYFVLKFFMRYRLLNVARTRRRCQRHLQCALNGMRPFSFFEQKSFLRYLDFWTRQGRDGGVNGTYKVPLTVCEHFHFSFQKSFCDISISGRSTGATEVSTALTRCPEQYATIFIFVAKKFFAISRFLDVIRARRRCQRHLQGSRNCMQPYSFFLPKKFFCDITISGCGTGAT